MNRNVTFALLLATAGLAGFQAEAGPFTPDKQYGKVVVKNETGREIEYVIVNHKYSNNYKDKFAWFRLANGDLTKESMTVRYHTGFGTTGVDWWKVSWKFKGESRLYFTNPKNGRAIIDAMEGITAKVGPSLVTLSATAAATGAGAPAAGAVAAPFVQVAAEEVANHLFNGESTDGFKRHMLTSDDVKERNWITIRKSEVEFWSVSGKSYTGFTSVGIPATATPTPNPVPQPTPRPVVTIAQVRGVYQRDPIQNGYHKGRIAEVNGQLRWSNDAGASWSLFPNLHAGLLSTNEENPYFQTGARDFTLQVQNGSVTGFLFQGEFYRRSGELPPQPVPNPVPLSIASVQGVYHREPVQNGYHSGQIRMTNGGGLRWSNESGVSWSLFPDLAAKKLSTNQENPYFQTGARDFTLRTQGTQVTGFEFQGEFYRRVGN